MEVEVATTGALRGDGLENTISREYGPKNYQDIKLRDYLGDAFGYLSSAKDLFSVGVVCKAWRESSKARELWEPHLRELRYAKPADMGFREAYFHLHHGIGTAFKERKLTEHTLDTSGQRVYSVAFSTDGALFATGSQDGGIGLWDAQSRECVAKFNEHTKPVTSLSFVRREEIEYLVSGSAQENLIKVWSITELLPTDSITTIRVKDNSNPICDVVATQNHIAALNSEGCVPLEVWTWTGADSIPCDVFLDDEDYGLAIAMDEKSCVVALNNHTIKVHSFDGDDRDYLFLSPLGIQSVDEHHAL